MRGPHKATRGKSERGSKGRAERSVSARLGNFWDWLEKKVADGLKKS